MVSATFLSGLTLNPTLLSGRMGWSRWFYNRTKRESKSLKALQGNSFIGAQIWISILVFWREFFHKESFFGWVKVEFMQGIR
jgi:hypothetical protein